MKKIHVIQSIADLSLSHCAPDHVVANSTYTDAAMLMSGGLAFFIGTSGAFADYANRGFDGGSTPPYFLRRPLTLWSEYVCVSEQSEHKGDAVDLPHIFSDYLNALKFRNRSRSVWAFCRSTKKVYTDEGMFRQWASLIRDIEALAAKHFQTF